MGDGDERGRGCFVSPEEKEEKGEKRKTKNKPQSRNRTMSIMKFLTNFTNKPFNTKETTTMLSSFLFINITNML